MLKKLSDKKILISLGYSKSSEECALGAKKEMIF